MAQRRVELRSWWSLMDDSEMKGSWIKEWESGEDEL